VSNLSAPKKTVQEPGPADQQSANKTVYETSAGGVVLRHIRGAWQVALIEPNIINADTITRRAKARPEGTVFALPKGGVDEGETPEQSADREVFEETGVRGLRLFRLTTIRYLYVRSWGGREHVSKAVSFYLFLYASGRLGQISPDMRDEVRKAFWFPLDKAHRKLTYRGEREVLKMAQKIVREHPERLTPPASIQAAAADGQRPTAQQRGALPQRTDSQQRYPGAQRGQSQPRSSGQRNGNVQRNQGRISQGGSQTSSQAGSSRPKGQVRSGPDRTADSGNPRSGRQPGDEYHKRT
jgi:ADP-ribose pyrophosphatase YjhB (NUDIX family)